VAAAQNAADYDADHFFDDGTGTHFFQRKMLLQDVLSAMEIVTAKLVFLHMDHRG
jgi:hypothetical protein